MAYFYMMATGDFAQWMWKLPFVRGNALRIGMLIFPYAVAFYMTAVALNVLVAAKFSTPLDIGLSVPMVMWAVPMSTLKLAQNLAPGLMVELSVRRTCTVCNTFVVVLMGSALILIYDYWAPQN